MGKVVFTAGLFAFIVGFIVGAFAMKAADEENMFYPQQLIEKKLGEYNSTTGKFQLKEIRG